MAPAGLSQTTIDLTICLLARHRLKQLDSIYRKLSKYLEASDKSCEFVVVASGVHEDGEEELKRFSENCACENGKLRIVKIRERIDKAGALKAIQPLIQGQVVILIETSGQDVAVEDIRNLMDRLEQGFDFVNGVRNWKGEPNLNQWQSGAFNWLTRKITGTKVRDLNSTIKVMKREVLENVPLYGDFYRFLPVLAERRGFRVTEVPVTRREEQKRNTVYGPISYGRRLLEILNLIFVTRFTEKPLRFFGGWGIFSVVIGILINSTLAIQKIFFGQGLADRPLLLFGILLIVIGIQSISIGLIGEMIVYSRTKEFKGSEIEEVR